jgi:hypothetical protein
LKVTHADNGVSVLPSTLADFITLLGFVDDINAALATHQLVVTMALTQCLERIADFHNLYLQNITAQA